MSENTNPRIFTVRENATTKILFSLAIWGGAMTMYYRRRFLVDQNMVNLALYTAGTSQVSLWVGAYLTDHPSNEAAKMNNAREATHQRLMGNSMRPK
jgi:hypothetical protein